ncbi:MAG TPA: hypothetical protein VNO35_27255, partial [Steroidobacteraceae bacterium]|nr:hypothetical protein [Steroidobacteraceae bacterium]
VRGWTAQTAAAGLNQLSKRLAWGSFASMDSKVTVEFSSLMCALQEGGKDVYTETQSPGDQRPQDGALSLGALNSSPPSGTLRSHRRGDRF